MESQLSLIVSNKEFHFTPSTIGRVIWNEISFFVRVWQGSTVMRLKVHLMFFLSESRPIRFFRARSSANQVILLSRSRPIRFSGAGNFIKNWFKSDFSIFFSHRQPIMFHGRPSKNRVSPAHPMGFFLQKFRPMGYAGLDPAHEEVWYVLWLEWLHQSKVGLQEESGISNRDKFCSVLTKRSIYANGRMQ